MKTALGLFAFLILMAAIALILPTRIRLELYEVQDLTYYSDYVVDSVNLPAVVEPDLICGEDLANHITAVLPGSWNGDSKRKMQFQNGLIIARTTSAQHIAIRAYLDAYRAKTTISAKLFGIIRK